MEARLSTNLDAFYETLISVLENARKTYIHKQSFIDDLIAQVTINLNKISSVSESLSERDGVLKKLVVEIIREMRLAENKLSDFVVNPNIKKSTDWLEQLVFNSEPVSQKDLRICTEVIVSRNNKIEVLLSEDKEYSEALESAEGELFSFNLWNETVRRERK